MTAQAYKFSAQHAALLDETHVLREPARRNARLARPEVCERMGS